MNKKFDKIERICKLLENNLIINFKIMPIVSVDVPECIVKQIKPFTVIKYEILLSYDNNNIAFDFEKENINQNEFLSHLKSKHS